MCNRDYCPSLTTVELLAQLAELLAEQRDAERLICRYLADLADRMAQPITLPSGYADVYHLARCRFGLSFRSTRERIRVGRALRDLPRTEQALISGKLGYSRVREVTRVARSDSEAVWLQAAQRLPIRELERRVAAASARQSSGRAAAAEAGEHGAAQPAWLPDEERVDARFLAPELIELRIVLASDAWAVLERALQGAKRASDRSLSDAEALTALARDALAQQTAGTADVRRTVVVYECRHCSRTELDTGGEPMDLSAEAAASLGCGARVIELERAGRLVRRGGPLPASVRRAVLLRDRCRCRVPGCGLRRYVDVHHLQEQSQGGVHSRSNCLCLCERHHRMLHAGQLRIEGDADAAWDAPERARFYHADGELRGEPCASVTTGSIAAAPLADISAAAWSREPRQADTDAGASTETHSGSSACGESSVGDGSPWVSVCGESSVGDGSQLSPEAARLLAIMGHRGGWHPDSLCEKSQLSASEVAIALTTLQLARQVFRDRAGRYAPLLPAAQN